MKNLKKPARLPRKAPSNQTGGTAWGKKLAAEFSRIVQSADMKKLILLNFPYIIAFYMVEKAAWLYRHCNGDSVVDRLMVLFMNFGLAYKSILPSFHPFDLMVGLVGAAALKAVIYFKGKNAKKYRQGEEYGSARWGNQKDIEPFIDPVFENNVILTQTERLMMSGRHHHYADPLLRTDLDADGAEQSARCRHLDVFQVFREDVDRGLSRQSYVRYCNGGI